MKKVILGLLLTAASFVLAKPALANEGVFHLVGPSEDGGSCFATSIYIDGNYKVLMTCRGLKMALDPVKNKYVVWANVGERKTRLGEIVSGKLMASIPDKFETIFVTLEPDAYSSKPTGVVAMTGAVAAIDFGKGTFDASLQPTVTPAITTVTTTTSGSPSRLTSVVVAIGKTILFGFILLLIVVGVMSFLARRKNL